MSTTDGQPTTENHHYIGSRYCNTDVLNPTVYTVAHFFRRPVH